MTIRAELCTHLKTIEKRQNQKRSDAAKRVDELQNAIYRTDRTLAMIRDPSRKKQLQENLDDLQTQLKTAKRVNEITRREYNLMDKDVAGNCQAYQKFDLETIQSAIFTSTICQKLPKLRALEQRHVQQKTKKLTETEDQLTKLPIPSEGDERKDAQKQKGLLKLKAKTLQDELAEHLTNLTQLAAFRSDHCKR